MNNWYLENPPLMCRAHAMSVVLCVLPVFSVWCILYDSCACFVLFVCVVTMYFACVVWSLKYMYWVCLCYVHLRIVCIKCSL